MVTEKRTKDPWAVAFSKAITTWSNENGINRMEIGVRLDIPVHRWAHAASGKRITVAEYYARVFCYTGLPEADPRTLPPRKSGSAVINRAMSESEWKVWAKKNRDRFCTSGVVESVSEASNHGDSNAQLEAAITVLSDVLNQGNEKVFQAFLAAHRKQILKLNSLSSIFKIEDPADRQAVLEAKGRYANK